MSEHTNVAVDGLDDAGPADIVDDDLPSLLRRREHARPNRVTWILLALLLVSAGFVGGAYVEPAIRCDVQQLPTDSPRASRRRIPGGSSRRRLTGRRHGARPSGT